MKALKSRAYRLELFQTYDSLAHCRDPPLLYVCTLLFSFNTGYAILHLGFHRLMTFFFSLYRQLLKPVAAIAGKMRSSSAAYFLRMNNGTSKDRKEDREVTRGECGRQVVICSGVRISQEIKPGGELGA